MKYLKILITPTLLVLGVFIAIACEPDDICAEGTATTPRLIIDFYNVLNPEAQKNVFDLVVVGVGNNSVLDGYSFVDTDDVYLPLKTDDNTTQYALIADATINNNGTPDDETDDFLEGNQDIITINYSREEIYVSRACGYKTIYKNVTLTIEPDADNWMISRQPMTENQSVENEDEAHFIVTH
ncbi:hypothetical protein F6U93_00355 [Tamlana haliotis]|uniref:Uncharacterized protein n=1 Tax=Pseudotamlana haliotis TaxID=2614804 RepID=A0A6N6MMD2_9FLAO|nr:DUF6452 family protein [Tamlana haliotis]KAB1071929.1 hypothetical protein F6U93_00355 [Tamlana haliotis]